MSHLINVPRAALLAPFLALLLAAGPATALTIDDFHDGASLLEAPTMPAAPDGWLRSDTAASVPGGWRSLALQPVPGATSLAFIEASAGNLQAYRLPGQALYVSFGYGQTTPMNLDLGGQSALRIDVSWAGATMPGGAWNGQALELTVYATTSNGAGLNPDGSAAHAVLRDGAQLDLPFASFTTNASTGVGVDWADVDGLLFVVSESVVGATAGGFGITSVSAVPEPGAALLLGGGLLVLMPLLMRRRRRAVVLAAAALVGSSAMAADLVNITGFGSAGAGANIGSYPVAPGTLVDLFNPVLLDLAAGDYLVSDAWGQPGALYDTWNFETAAPGSWGSHYVAAEVLPDGGYRLLIDGLTLTEPTCKNHFCAWDTREQATAAFLATPAYRLHLDHAATVAFASADHFLPDNAGGISLQISAVPELPSALALAAGLVLLGAQRLRRGGRA